MNDSSIADDVSNEMNWQAIKEFARRYAIVWILILCGLHILAVWGYTGLFWGDQGLWLNEVERLSAGEKLYVDFYWSYPPVAIWLLGTVAKVFGADLRFMWTVTSSIFVLIFILYYFYTSGLVRRQYVLLSLVSGFLLSTAYANHWSAPLPSGMYSPAAPIGFVFLLLAAIMLLKMLSKPRMYLSIGIGLTCAICILTKQEYWLPALYIMGTTAVISLISLPRKGKLAPLTLQLISFTFAMFIGLYLITDGRDWNLITGVINGFGQVTIVGGRSIPNLERITLESATFVLLTLFILMILVLTRAVSFKEARKYLVILVCLGIILCALHLFMTYRIGVNLLLSGVFGRFATQTEAFIAGYLSSPQRLVFGALMWLHRRLQLHLFSIFLPIGLAIFILYHWSKFKSIRKRNSIILLLGLATVLRVRRLGEWVEWYNLLIEIPLLIAAIDLYITDIKGKTTNGLRFVLLTLVGLGVFYYWFMGVGPLTRAGNYQKVETGRGSVYWTDYEANAWNLLVKEVERIDPTGEDTLFSFGYAGGFNYFLERSNPTPLTQGFFSF